MTPYPRDMPGVRHMNMESIYEYGSRAGFWRLWRTFTRLTGTRIANPHDPAPDRPCRRVRRGQRVPGRVAQTSRASGILPPPHGERNGGPARWLCPVALPVPAPSAAPPTNPPHHPNPA